jgi:hypothetical protein
LRLRFLCIIGKIILFFGVFRAWMGFLGVGFIFFASNLHVCAFIEGVSINPSGLPYVLCLLICDLIMEVFMACVDKRARFVALRGGGVSYLKISEEIGVSTRTLVRWSKELVLEISNQRALEYERLREEYMLGREHQIRIAGAQLSQITQELLNRELDDVATPKLFEMRRKMLKEINEHAEEIVFAEETTKNPSSKLNDMFKKVEKWTG